MSHSDTSSPGVREGFTTVTPYLAVANAEAYVAFLKQAFNAEEPGRSRHGSGGLHAELRLGDSMLMCGDSGYAPPRLCPIHYQVPDVDATFQLALDAGAKPLYPVEDKPYGERQGGIVDPAGN